MTMKQDLNAYIKKSHLKAVEKFNAELEAWRKETGEEAATLYEDANTSFTLANVRVEDGYLMYEYDGRTDSDMIVCTDQDTGELYEDECIDGIMDSIKFWRKCLKRAKKYWAMDPDELDAIQDGDKEDIETEEE